MKHVIIILTYAFAFPICLKAQQVEKIIESGNDFYKKQKYSDAEKEYKKISPIDSSGNIAKFNLGNAQYKLGEKDEAITTYNTLINSGKDSEMLSSLYYNKGVILGSQQKLEESIKAYESALIKDPDDKETRENLQKALLELKKQNESKKNADNNKKKQQKKQQPPPPAMNQKEAEKKLKELEQKEKKIQQRMQKNTTGNSAQKDW